MALAAGVVILAAGCSRAPQADAEPRVTAASDIAAGRYLVILGGCNDCHTAGWAAAYGAVPEAQWLTGNPLGRKGPWGTTYAQNLRLIPAAMSEDDFVTLMRTRKARPPMPWMNINRYAVADTRAIYRYLESLGPAGVAMPPGLAPGEIPATPYTEGAVVTPTPGPRR